MPSLSSDVSLERKMLKPRSFKEMKKFLNDSLVDIETDVRENNLADGQYALTFKQMVDDFSERAKPAWRNGVNELEILSQKLLATLGKNEVSESLVSILQIWELKEKYHKIFK